MTVSNFFKRLSANLLNVQAGLLDTFDESEPGGERRERRRKDSGASEQEEEVTLRSFYHLILVTNKTVKMMYKICLHMFLMMAGLYEQTPVHPKIPSMMEGLDLTMTYKVFCWQLQAVIDVRRVSDWKTMNRIYLCMSRLLIRRLELPEN